MKRTAILSLLFLLAPYCALASVQITEIMYDVPGSDSKREWIEITNTGADAVDVSKYHLAEGGVNHKLSVVLGTSTILAGGSVVIAADPATFTTDWPQFTGTLFDSTFSLSNSGETFAIKDASSTLVDSVSYMSSMGAGGNGGSLHRQGNTFVPAMPNPGTFPGILTPVPKKEVISKATKVAPAPPKVSKAASPPVAKTIPSNLPTDSELAAASALLPVLPWVMGLGVIIVLGALGALFMGKETSTRKSEFEIINDK